MTIKFKEKSLYFTSLGCSKNLVDSQVMLGHLGLDGFRVTDDPKNAEVIIVNTCSFIEASKIESIETVLDLAEYKGAEDSKCQALVMSGCMAQRYYKDLEQEMPEVDLFIGTGEYQKIVPLLRALEEGKLEKKSFVEIPKYIHTEFDPRINTGPKHMAWLKVSEGCNRNCTFCIIPTLRGRLRSRSVESLVSETKKLVESGVKEINIISQDLSDYGVDLEGFEGKKDAPLVKLIAGLDDIADLAWVRLFYMYPDDLTEELMAAIAGSKKVCRYLDMPIQHFSTNVLKRMNRRVLEEQIFAKIKRLRDHVPNIILRTSVIVGFPGETEEDFQKLLNGIRECRFNHLGVFKYSDEEGTPAYKLNPKVPQEVIDERFQQVYELQKEIVRELNQSYLGKTISVLVEGPHPETPLLLQGRHQGQAPDIDGNVLINDGSAEAGDIVQVKITEVLDYDLVGEIVS
jgi:ribosomal protein S12 methylthiotransferase